MFIKQAGIPNKREFGLLLYYCRVILAVFDEILYNNTMVKRNESYRGNAVRINKYLSEAGVCSRREADRLIAAGKVTIDGNTAVLGSTVETGQTVLVNGKMIRNQEPEILLAFHKPRGIVCTAEKREKNNIVDYINYPFRIYPVGRLDKDSEGLILMTNQGEIVNKIMRSGNAHEKEYIVKVDKEITAEFLKDMSAGVPVLDTVTRPCKIRRIGKYTFSIILTQGLNRQIRRMCEYFGYHVKRLKRIRIMNIELKELPVGKYREVTEEEKRILYRSIQNSSNTTVRFAGDRNGQRAGKSK